MCPSVPNLVSKIKANMGPLRGDFSLFKAFCESVYSPLTTPILVADPLGKLAPFSGLRGK